MHFFFIHIIIVLITNIFFISPLSPSPSSYTSANVLWATQIPANHSHDSLSVYWNRVGRLYVWEQRMTCIDCRRCSTFALAAQGINCQFQQQPCYTTLYAYIYLHKNLSRYVQKTWSCLPNYIESVSNIGQNYDLHARLFANSLLFLYLTVTKCLLKITMWAGQSEIPNSRLLYTIFR